MWLQISPKKRGLGLVLLLALLLTPILSGCDKRTDEQKANDAITNCSTQLIKKARIPTSLTYQRLVYFVGSSSLSSCLYGQFRCQDSFGFNYWHSLIYEDGSATLTFDNETNSVTTTVSNVFAMVPNDRAVYETGGETYRTFFEQLDSINSTLSSRAAQYAKDGTL